MTALSFGYPYPEAYDDELRDLVDASVASRIAIGDSSIWGPAARSEASKRLGWVTLPETSRPLLDRITALREALAAEGVDRVVLAGMGGSSLAPEVICATHGVDLVVVDSTDPAEVAAAFATELERTVFVVSSKSGGTVETDSALRYGTERFTAAGIDAASRIVVVTDPGSPLAEASEQRGYREVFLADPQVGGRFSALSAFGLVPSGLAGADVARLLDEAAAIAPELAEDSEDNPALQLGTFLGVAHARDTEKLVIARTNSEIVGLPAWLEQLIAESTGKDGQGILPVVVEDIWAPGFADARADAVLLFIGEAEGDHQPSSGFACAIQETLGAQFYLWEYATAIAGYSIGINPFDQPDVEAAKVSARAFLASGGAVTDTAAALVETDALSVDAGPSGFAEASSLTEVLATWLEKSGEYGYLGIQAYIDRSTLGEFEELRPALAEASGLQTTFGYGPRFLHSTGQYHKGGHPNGLFLQITTAHANDVEVPGAGFSFGTLQSAQAAGDRAVLLERGRPVVHVHLKDVKAGLAELREAIAAL